MTTFLKHTFFSSNFYCFCGTLIFFDGLNILILYFEASFKQIPPIFICLQNQRFLPPAQQGVSACKN